MAFGIPRASSVVRASCSEGDLADVADGIERLLADLSRWRSALDAAGAPLAATYVEGAWDALSFALEAALWADGGVGGATRGDDAWIGARRVRFVRDGTLVYADLAGIAAVAPPPPSHAGRSIGADLAMSPGIVSALRADDVAAALMAATLAHSDWIHAGSDEVFRGDPLAARAVVATVVARTSFPTWTRRQMGGLIHRGSAELLGELGWLRLRGAALPSA